MTQTGVEPFETNPMAIVRSSHDAIVSKTLDGVITSWNDAAEQLYGYPRSEIIGSHAEILYPVERRPEEARILRQVARGERLDQYVTDRVRRDGTSVTVSLSASPVLDAVGRITGIATISRDIGRVRGVANKWRAMLEAAPDAIVAVDADGRITVVNAQTERLFGYRRDELIGQLIEVLVPEQARHVHPRHRERYLREPKPRPMGAGIELSALRRDGTQFPAEISLSAIKTEDGELVAAAIRDVSERIRFERQLRDKNIELEKANKAKDAFLASMSHELRTPLNAIIGFTGTLLMGLPGPLNEAQVHQLQLVETSGQHLLSLINDLLDLAKIESGKVEISPENVDCCSVVEEVVSSMRPLAEQRGITLVADLPAESCVAVADRRALGQILINLVHNAIKFSSEGDIRIALHRRTGEPWILQVTDHGPGIPVDEQVRIFGAFERSAAARKQSDEGTGLGLYISHKLAELMGCTLSVDSIPGHGSTFYVTLPV
ncbi:PAS domain-containing sensor histidine kinase [Dactylosporangium sp. CA-092794]|uniref:PAS domain-containing sensor histidine kinase n=1 Tax=Dactylosporangium sp. CA-092794 TaxID=3239929 RepID=UPI003D942523